ncbi:putative Casbene synthase, chloroplast precursor [Hibiscus syriacus]|uniref:Casbene synthase, chloroplast n=1 Tax=Hibiscus syriacus TaxID=106335 RepID=A0A6A2Z2N3_HIBSY|nr:putative Casbene synthase, chloroplast precursor [Hibiscus syriacus]
MNKGTGVGIGPTAAAAAAAAQKQKTMMHRVDTDIASIVDNFTQLVNVARLRGWKVDCIILNSLMPANLVIGSEG